MWAWLERLLPRERSNLYRPRQRQIYHYWNGQKVIAADPMILYKRIMDVGPELDAVIRIAASQSKEAPRAYHDMLVLVRGIFDLQALAEGGLTETEAAGLLDHFMLYTSELKKNGSPPATSSTSSAPTPSSESGDAASATRPTSDSGSTANACSTGGPGPSPTASVLPSA